MIEEKQINTIAKSVATANLSNAFVSVQSAPGIDSQGDAALKITIVLTNGSTSSISGEAALKTLSQIQQGLLKAGEDRFPIIEYATEEELSEGSD